MSLQKLAIVLFLSLMSLAGYAQVDLVEKTYSGISKDTNPQLAKKEIQDTGAMSVAEEMIRDLIGNERYQKNKSSIDQKIIKQNAKFIPFMKTGELVSDADGYKMQVLYKLSLTDLRGLLKSTGFLNESESFPVMIPLIRWQDKKSGVTQAWWIKEGNVPESLKKLEETLKTTLLRNGFHLLDVYSFGLEETIPSELKGGDFDSSRLSSLAQELSINLALVGDCTISPLDSGAFRLDVKLQIIQMGNQKLIAEIVRKFETEPGPQQKVVDKKWKEIIELVASDISSQATDAWQRGTVNANLLQIEHLGFLSLTDQEKLKDRIKVQLPQVKTIRERRMSSDSTVFEVETSFLSDEFAQRLPGLDFGGKKISVLKTSGDKIQFEFK